MDILYMNGQVRNLSPNFRVHNRMVGFVPKTAPGIV